MPDTTTTIYRLTHAGTVRVGTAVQIAKTILGPGVHHPDLLADTAREVAYHGTVQA